MELLYPGTHELTIASDQDIYTVQLNALLNNTAKPSAITSSIKPPTAYAMGITIFFSEKESINWWLHPTFWATWWLDFLILLFYFSSGYPTSALILPKSFSSPPEIIFPLKFRYHRVIRCSVQFTNSTNYSRFYKRQLDQSHCLFHCTMYAIVDRIRFCVLANFLIY